PARLEIVLDAQALLARDRAVMRVDQLLTCELVHRIRDPFREAPAVDEDEGRAMLADELEEPRVDRRPDARPRVGSRRGTAADLERLGAQLRHVVDRDLDTQVELLRVTSVHDLHRSLTIGVEANEEPRDLIERPLRGGKADALKRMARELLEPFERERKMRTALGRDHRVDLVH